MPRIKDREETWRNLVASNLEPYQTKEGINMGLYIIALGHLCKRWWFAIFMIITLWYLIYCFATGIDAYVNTVKTYLDNLGI